MSASCEFVVMRAGLTVPVEALLLALDLESRGVRLALDGDALLVGPRGRLTDEDRASIRRWKPHLLAIVSYNADALQDRAQ
jgi:TubC N-terminal docking domain